MQRIVNIFYTHLVTDRLRGKRGAEAALEATSGGAGAQGEALEGVGAEERKAKTKGWGKIKMAVGDENMMSGEDSAAANAFAGGVSSLKSKLMLAKLKAAELVDKRMEEEGEEEEEEVRRGGGGGGGASEASGARRAQKRKVVGAPHERSERTERNETKRNETK
jgi:hypothetical protein